MTQTEKRRLRDRPVYPDSNYRDAALFISRLHFNRRRITRQQYADIRGQALSGDLDGASMALGDALARKWA